MQMKTLKSLAVLAVLWLGWTLGEQAWAQGAAEGEIVKIEVRLAGGATGVDEAFVRSHIRLRVGDAYRPGLENEDVKTLMATGRFTNVSVFLKRAGGGLHLIFTAERARTTGTVILKGFDGEREISADRLKIVVSKLLGVMTTRETEPYLDRKVAADVRALEDYYRSKGYYDVSVNAVPVINTTTLDRDVTFTITEGERVKIEEIRFRLGRSINSIDTATDQLTTELPHGLVTGDSVRLFVQEAANDRAEESVPMPAIMPAKDEAGAQAAPMHRGAYYFVRVIARNQVTLHHTAGEAKAGGRRVDFVTVANVPHYLETPLQPERFTVKELAKTLETKERRRWWSPVSWFKGDGRIMDEKMNLDIVQMRKKYRDNGHLDVVVDIDKSPDVDYAPGSEYDKAHRAWRRAEKRLDDFSKDLDKLQPGETQEIDGQLYNQAQLEVEVEKAEDVESAAYKKYKAARKAVYYATMTYRVVEGRQYKVGEVQFRFGGLNAQGIYTVNPGIKPVIPRETLLLELKLRPGEIFQPDALKSGTLGSDVDAISNAYGRKAYNKTEVNARSQPDPDKGVIDITYDIVEGKPVFIELIKIEGNVETKDIVVRRELAVSPGEPFDMGRVKLSEERIRGLRLFSEVRTESEPLPDFPDRENLILSVKERKTARAGFGGGFSTDYGAFGHVFYSEENFDILRWRQPHPLQGGGQKFRIRAALGSRRDDYTLDFEEPWMFGRKLRFTSSIYASEYEYYSDYYDVSRAGIKLGLERTLFGRDYLRGGINYTFESTGIYNVTSSASSELKDDAGRDTISKFGLTLAYDTRGGGYLPDKGQRTELLVEGANSGIGSDKDFYRLQLTSAQYFKGMNEGHIIETIFRTGVVERYGDTKEVPFIERYALGGSSTMRGFDFREVGPVDSKNEVIGGKTMAMASLEYSVPVPLGEWIRFGTFYDIGVVARSAYDYSFSDYNDNWGIGLRLDIPMLGPMRLDYAFPISTSSHNDGGGQFNFTFGYTQAF